MTEENDSQSRWWSLPMRVFTNNLSRQENDIPKLEQNDEVDLSQSIFIASGAVKNAHEATDYRNSAEKIRLDLVSARDRLNIALKTPIRGHFNSVARHKEECIALLTLARIHTTLGDYNEAEEAYEIASRNIATGTPSHSSVARRNSFRDREQYEKEISRNYMSFSANTGRNTSIALALATQALNAPIEDSESVDSHVELLLTLARINLAKGLHAEALATVECIGTLKDTSDLQNAHTATSFALTRARSLAGIKQQREARSQFLAALVTSAAVFGIWRPGTLKVMFFYGLSLMEWGEDKAATAILGECFLGRYYRFGKLHPTTQEAMDALSRCKSSGEQINDITRLFESTDSGERKRLSIAYEHIYLNTILDVLVAAGEAEAIFPEVEATLEGLLANKLKRRTAEHPAIFVLRVRRAIARAKFEQGRIDDAIHAIEETNRSTKRSVEGELQSKLDLIILYLSKESTKGKANELSRYLFFDADSKLKPDQADAYRRRLSVLGCTHFPFDIIGDHPLPIEYVDNIGVGAHAVVASIKINSRLYARKSVALPRYNRVRVRQILQNEVSIIRSLEHPHIVEVLCTYEERMRFAIVLQPLADCDLEVYLDRMSQERKGAEPGNKVQLVQKWLHCLSNTLAFIHSKGIRHKDIKTRNILVKDDDVLFADFGSSHAFLDEGTSVTEGPAFGHTVMYCAPEVVGWERRGRGADVFSLGCVFTEMLTWLTNRDLSEFYDFRIRINEQEGIETHAYHATLDRIDQWFDKTTGVGNELYQEVVKPMLSKDPRNRPTALDVSSTLEKCFSMDNTDLSKCERCTDHLIDMKRSSTFLDTSLDGSAMTAKTSEEI